MPKFSGGRLDDFGGRRRRIEDIVKFKTLESHLKRAAFLTLTIDRRQFSGPEAAYDKASPLVSKLVSERLGLRTWARVAEVQSKSGDGWIHWHVVIDLAEWRGDLRSLRKRIWQVWRDEWHIGGCDVKPCRKSVAGYVAKYVTKAWPAIPVWMGRSTKRFRLVGFSKRAGELIRGGRSMAVRPPVQSKRHRRYRPTRTLFERLAASGLETVLIMREPDGTSRLVGSLSVPEHLAVMAAKMVGGVKRERVQIERPDGSVGEVVRDVLPRVRSFERAKRFHAALMREVTHERPGVGLTMEAAAERMYADHLKNLRWSWALKMEERERGG